MYIIFSTIIITKLVIVINNTPRFQYTYAGYLNILRDNAYIYIF